MKYRKLGNTDLDVSLIALGTMTWGEQNSEADAHAQLDYAVAHGVNLIDTAEMYPVPPRPETQGATERYIGSWLARPGKRERVLIATKAAGPSHKLVQARHLRGGNTRHDRANLEAALHGSLRRLGTEVIALINGNFAISSGLKLTEAVALEKTPDHYLNVVAVKTDDKDKPWARDLVAAFRTPEYRAALDKHFAGYARPAYLQ